jgi:hypothetical protein
MCSLRNATTNRVIQLTPALFSFCHNLTSYTQSAGNQKESAAALVGSSEPTCEGSFDFTSFWKHHKYIDPGVASMGLVGFTEGD